MKPPLSYLPALPVAIGLAIGVIVADSWGWMWGLTLGLLGFAVLYSRHLHYASFCFLFVALGSISYYAHEPMRLPDSYHEEVVNCTGRIASVSTSAIGQSCIVELSKLGNSGIKRPRILLNTNGTDPEYEPGMIVSWKGRLESVQPKVKLTSDESFLSYLWQQGIVAQGFATKTAITVVSEPYGWDSMVNGCRRSIYNAIVDSPISGKAASLLIALLLGDQTYLTPDFKDAYLMSGVAHILAISGMHLGIILALVSFVLMPLGLIRGGIKFRLIFTVCLIWAFALIVGLPTSVQRASIMISVYLLTRFSKYGSSPGNSMLVALALILIVNPRDLFSAGLQLSFAAVATILLFSHSVPDSWRKKGVMYYLNVFVFIPVVAMLGTGVLSAYYFHILPLHFLGANMIAGLFLPLFIISGIVLAFTSVVGVHFATLGLLVDWTYKMMDRGIQFMGHWSGPLMENVYFSAWTFVPYAFCILALGLAWYKREERKKALNYLMSALGALFATAAVIVVTSNPVKAIEIRRGSSIEDFMPPKNQDSRILRAGHFLWADGHWLRILDNEDIVLTPEKIAPTYGIVGFGYKGTARDAKKASRADTLVFSADLHPRRAASLRKQCGDSIPYIDLRHRGILIKRKGD